MNPARHLKKFSHEQLSDICAQLDLPPEVAEAINKQESDTAILSKLIEIGQYPAAVKFLALGLPKREAVWWAYLCAEDAERDSNCLKTQNALKVTNEWVRNPSEENRQKTQGLAEALELYTPASWAAMSAFWSGDNIAPANRPAVKPSPYMAGEAVSNAIVLAANKKPSAQDAYKLYLKQGLHIAMGGNGRIA
jgi:hypothetical protein